MRSPPNSWPLHLFTMGIPVWWASSRLRMRHCPDSISNTENTSPINTGRSLRARSCIMALIAISSMSSTRTESGHHPTSNPTTGVHSRVAKGCALAFATMTAGFAQKNMSGTVATCMALASIWPTWHRRVTGMFRSPKMLVEEAGIA